MQQPGVRKAFTAVVLAGLCAASIAWATGALDVTEVGIVPSGVSVVDGASPAPDMAAEPTTGAPMVTTSSGPQIGAAPDARGIIAFKGIPYAQPPVGALRWRSPQPVQPAALPRPALAFGPSCMAAPGANPDLASNEALPQSEDCLTLNIWSPRVDTRARKAVMVWIHGGGFQFSGSARKTWDGSMLSSHDVVVISLNYRLGVFGFLATPALDGESGHSGDWGLEDQIAALKWVKANIRNFGGDPDRVTIFGESAGAHSVGLLMASPQARGLFHRAILESGATWDTDHGSLATHAQALQRGAEFQARFADQDLRAIPADVINAAAPWDYLSDPTLTAFAPSVDNYVLPESPGKIFAEGRQVRVPTMGGWNAAEYIPFVSHVLPAPPAALFYDAAARQFGQACLSEFQRLYPAADPTNAVPSSLQLAGDLVIGQQTWEALFWQAKYRPTYGYRFTYTSDYSPVAIHTAEVPFVWGTLTRQATGPTAAPSEADRALSEQMMRYWTNFARTGNPNGAGLPDWPAMTTGGDRVLELKASPAAQANPDIARFQFVRRYREAGRLPEQWKSLTSPFTIQYRGPGCP